MVLPVRLAGKQIQRTGSRHRQVVGKRWWWLVVPRFRATHQEQVWINR